ncbi:nucleotide-binding domain-containing protein [Mycena vitilis]|nr:nucleotide-binding domain-containing protein [Mycena vitilis]
MGSLLSRLRLIYQTLKSISDSFSALSERLSRDPGLPGRNPSRSYWCSPPSPLDRFTGAPLPEYADVVIMGSGIASTAIARTLLDSQSSSEKGSTLRVVMLEARDVCSGATGRNGGHVSPNTYQDYAELEAKYGERTAQAIIRFQENLLSESQTREVEQFDVFLRDTLYQRAKDALARYLTAHPERRGTHKTHEDTSTFEDSQLSSQIAGCISQEGGALHPYRLITVPTKPNLPHSFQLLTNTPCTNIALAPRMCVHATNAWVSHLLPGMRRKIVPIRVHMTAQRPGRSLWKAGNASSWAGTRAFVFYPWTSMLVFDYLTQQPGGNGQSSASRPAGELMFGGGAMLGGRAEATMMDNIGITDDSESDFEALLRLIFFRHAYLGGALERYFAPGWGEESAAAAPQTEDQAWGTGRVKAAWSGIMGLSADGQPWDSADTTLARPGEWIAAGFTGEGMTHAWLSGVALASILLGRESVPDDDASALPSQLLITEKRWKEADIEAFLADTGVQ